MNAGSNFSLSEVTKSAWHNLKGSKWAVWGPLLTYFLIYIGVVAFFMLVINFFSRASHQSGMSFFLGSLVAIVILEIIVIFVTSPLIAGIQMNALRKMRGESVSASDGFQFWKRWMPLGFTVLIFAIGSFLINQIFNALTRISMGSTTLVLIWTLLLIFASLFYITFFVFNILAVADKNRGPFQALAYSAKIVAPAWFRVLLMLLWIAIISMVMALPAILGLLCPVTWVKILGVVVSAFLYIWVLPYSFLLFAGTYNKLAHD